jgi:hypothetical protein
MATDIQMHSVIALLEDLPQGGLVRGQVGAVVETWAPGVYEVEFVNRRLNSRSPDLAP